MTLDGRLAAEAEVIAKVDRERALRPGELTPRQRIEHLVDPGSWLEIGRLARSQQPSAADLTPADGVITGWARIGGREAAVLAEDTVVRARTDGQVAENKRQRLLATAAQRGALFVALLDGSDPASEADTTGPGFGTLDGGLFGHLADATPMATTPHPLIAVAFGPGSDALMASEADVVIATQAAGGLGAPVDLWVPDDDHAVTAARAVAAMAEAGDATPRPPTAALGADTTDEATTDDLMAGLADGGSTVWLDRAGQLRTGLCRIGGFPVAFTAPTGEPESANGLTVSDLAILRRVIRMARRLETGLLLVQNTPGYAPGATRAAGFASELSALIAEVRDLRGPKVCLITGRGNVLGTFALGGWRLGMDYRLAWPWAQIPVLEGGDPPDGPWLAAGMGIVDDVITPEETRDRLVRMLDILAPTLVLPTPEEGKQGRLVDEISKV